MDRVFRGWGFEIPLPRRAVVWLAALVVAGVAGFLTNQLLVPVITQRVKQKQIDIDRAEYQKHFDDRSDPARHLDQVVYNDAGKGFLKITYYTSDGCLFIVRGSPDATKEPIQHWIQASFYAISSPRPAAGSQASGRPPEPPIGIGAALALAVPPASDPVPAQTCTGRCVSPHLGQFSSWNGAPNGCWTQVWRRWPDGCTHYQYYNTRTGYWDSLPDGSPKVSWTCCVH